MLGFLFRIFTELPCPGPGSAAAESAETSAVIRAATERTVSKACIAVARLCLDPATADTVLDRGGLQLLLPLAEDAADSSNTTGKRTVNSGLVGIFKISFPFKTFKLRFRDFLNLPQFPVIFLGNK